LILPILGSGYTIATPSVPVLPMHIVGTLGGLLAVYDRAAAGGSAPMFWSSTAAAAVSGAVQIDHPVQEIAATDTDTTTATRTWRMPSGRLGKPVVASATYGTSTNCIPPIARLYQRGEDWPGESYDGWMRPR
jgi:hypothetical protein